MAFSRSVMAIFLLSLLSISHLTKAADPHKMEMVMNSIAPSPGPGQKIDCGGECKRRCSETKRPNLCKRACGSCCDKCGCVPPGTYGHLEACPCYAKLTTRQGVHKCP